MIKDKDLAQELELSLQKVFRLLDETAAVVRDRSESEADNYATAIGTVIMSIYSNVLDPIYCDHPDIAPDLWSMDP